jgi:hypothetical protein
MAALKLGTLIDRLYKANQEVGAKKRLVAKAEQEVKRAQAKANKIDDEIRERFKQGDINGAVGKVGRAELKTLTSAQLADWPKLVKYVMANDAADLFQRRINKSAWLERLAERKNRPIPGIKKYDRVVLSVTKKR